MGYVCRFLRRTETMLPAFGFIHDDDRVLQRFSLHARLRPSGFATGTSTRRSFSLSLLLAVLATRLPAQGKPQRIVCTTPGINETLFALGLGRQVVGVSQYCDYPPEVQKLPKVGTYIKPDAEAIAWLVADLVILLTLIGGPYLAWAIQRVPMEEI